MRKLHAILTIVWLILIIPSALWWNNSIAWLVFMSAYAIVASHFSGFQGARAERAANINGDEHAGKR
jgi:uncharacterized protein (DUF58 family)